MAPRRDPARFADDAADYAEPVARGADGEPLYQWRAELPGLGDALLPERPPYLEPDDAGE